KRAPTRCPRARGGEGPGGEPNARALSTPPRPLLRGLTNPRRLEAPGGRDDQGSSPDRRRIVPALEADCRSRETRPARVSEARKSALSGACTAACVQVVEEPATPHA